MLGELFNRGPSPGPSRSLTGTRHEAGAAPAPLTPPAPGNYNSRRPPRRAHTPGVSLAEAAHQSGGAAGPGQPMGTLLLTRRSYF